MKEHPILFSTDMVKAILDGRKTMTRRILKPQPDAGLEEFDRYAKIEVGKYAPTLIDKDGEQYPGDEIFGAYTDDGEWGWKCPYGQVGDRLWVREKFYFRVGNPDAVIYFDGTEKFRNGHIIEHFANVDRLKWKPAIHMFRDFSRITLEITDIRVERVQEITEEDIRAEGFYPHPGWPEQMFDLYWDKLNAKRGYSFESNPWVWVISFKVSNKCGAL